MPIVCYLSIIVFKVMIDHVNDEITIELY